MSKLKFVGRRLVLAAAVLLLLGTAASAATIGLNTLVAGGSFDSDDGTLTFSNFSVTKQKGIGNLSDVIVTTEGDGFNLSSSAFTVSSGKLRKLDISYTVTVKSEGGSIGGADMTLVASASSGGRVKVQKDYEDRNSDEGTFLLTLVTSNNSILTDSDTFAAGVTSLDVDEAIRIKKTATLTSVSNNFTVTTVPEPAQLTLLAAGLAGLTWLGGSRKRS